MGVLRIETDAGIVGTNFLSYPGPGPEAIAREIVTFVKPLLLGADPLEIGRHWRRLCGLGHFISPITLGVVDVALWDIAGQAAGLPIHQLLGHCRDRLPVYLSSAHHASAQDYADEAAYWREQGWRGYKLHPPRAPWRTDAPPPISFDIDACARVRDAGGRRDDTDARRHLELLLRGRIGGWAEDRGAGLPLVSRIRSRRWTSTATAGSSSTCGFR